MLRNCIKTKVIKNISNRIDKKKIQVFSADKFFYKMRIINHFTNYYTTIIQCTSSQVHDFTSSQFHTFTYSQLHNFPLPKP